MHCSTSADGWIGVAGRFFWVVLFWVGSISAVAASGGASPPGDISHETFRLPNGLRVLVHTDQTVPVVTVHVSYQVGSRDEPPGRSGLAHLFEHLMFKRTVHRMADYATFLEAAGAIDVDGRTEADRTFYTQTVPTSALDLALWLESDRMGHLHDAIDGVMLEEQRGVVQNEKRQGQNQPYGQVRELLLPALYPEGHPYHHGVIGSINDLDAATVEDVRAWFRQWYGPNNAVLVLAGDIDLETAREKSLLYFGDLSPGPSVERVMAPVLERSVQTRASHEDRVARTRIHKAWTVDSMGTPGFDLLQLAGYVLGGGRSSRLARRLQHQDGLVDGVSLSLWGGQLASRLWVSADVSSNVDVGAVEAAIDEEFMRFIEEGPTVAELDRSRTALRAAFARSIEKTGGVGGRADVLAACAVISQSSGCSRASFQRMEAATPGDVQRAAARWLARGDHVLTILPGRRIPLVEAPARATGPLVTGPPDARATAVETGLDRRRGPPEVHGYPQVSPLVLRRAMLSNGTRVVVAEQAGAGLAQVRYEFPAGFRTDGRSPGLSAFTFNMLDEGAGSLDALEFASEAEGLGVEIGVASGLDSNAAFISALPEKLAPALGLLAEMVRRPRFDAGEIERMRGNWLAAIHQEEARPHGMALRLLAPMLYGERHPYAGSFTGLGTEEAVGAITREDLLRYHGEWIRPEGATVIAAGAVKLETLVTLLEEHFGDWRGANAPGQLPELLDSIASPEPRVVLVNQPGALQTTIFAGQLVTPAGDPAALGFDAADAVFSGTFGSRLNTSLREEKGWSYGTYSLLPDTVGPRPWVLVAPVDAERTGEALEEIRHQLFSYFGGESPVTEAELARYQQHETRSATARLETVRSLVSEIGNLVRYGRSDDYAVRRRLDIEGLSSGDVGRMASVVEPARLSWVIVGDAENNESLVRELGLGPVSVLDR